MDSKHWGSWLKTIRVDAVCCWSLFWIEWYVVLILIRTSFPTLFTPAQDQSELAYSELGVYPCKMVMVGIGEGITGQWSHNSLVCCVFCFWQIPKIKKDRRSIPRSPLKCYCRFWICSCILCWRFELESKIVFAKNRAVLLHILRKDRDAWDSFRKFVHEYCIFFSVLGLQWSTKYCTS